MSYTPTNWATGDTITASALNKIENGVANAGGGYDAVIQIVDGTPDTGTVISGDFQTVYNKAMSLPVSILVNLDRDGDKNVLIGSSWIGDYGGQYLHYRGFCIDSMSASTINLRPRVEFTWDANGLRDIVVNT